MSSIKKDQIVLTNIIKMFAERKYISDERSKINEILNMQPNDLTYHIKIDDGSTISIKFMLQKITAVNKTSGINDFLNYFKDNHKFIVVNSINKKAHQYIKNNYKNTEIFSEEELMINLVDHVLVPKHELLSDQEKDIFFDKYHCKKRSVPKMLTSDPIARYYNMKPNDIVRITRPSKQSGYSRSFRLVIKGDLK